MAKRKQSILTAAGNRAKRETERAMLLETLTAHAWNLSHAAKALEMGPASGVLQAIKVLGLDEEYEQARTRGDVRAGRRPWREKP